MTSARKGEVGETFLEKVCSSFEVSKALASRNMNKREDVECHFSPRQRKGGISWMLECCEFPESCEILDATIPSIFVRIFFLP